MRPRDTTYRLAYDLNDYRRCHRLLRQLRMDEGPLGWPTVMAIRAGQLVGCLSTQPHHDALIAGPLAIATKRPLLTLMRLVEAYEIVLWETGISAYHFGIELPVHAAWLALVEKAGFVPYQRHQDAAWFERHVPIAHRRA